MKNNHSRYGSVTILKKIFIQASIFHNLFQSIEVYSKNYLLRLKGLFF